MVWLPIALLVIALTQMLEQKLNEIMSLLWWILVLTLVVLIASVIGLGVIAILRCRCD